MSIQLKDTRIQQLVNQMVGGGEKLSAGDVQTLIDTAYSDDQKLSGEEKASLRSLLREHSDKLDSPEAQKKLQAFGRMSNASLRDAAHQFAQDGQLSQADAGQLRDLATTDGLVSKREKVTLKALMGFYAPNMEPGAEEVLSNLVKPSADPVATTGPVASNGPALSTEAELLVAKIAADDTITTVELQAAEAEIAATHGPDKAKTIMMEALGHDPSKLDIDAVAYLQGNIGAMDGHIEGFQNVLKAHVAGARLFDANFDGKLDGGDLLFTKDAAGKVNVESIGQALADRVRIGDAMVNASKEMAKAKHGFGDLKFNAGAWEVDEDEENPSTMYRNPDFPASVALMDIFNNPKMYQFECATAQVIVRYRAMLDLIGPEDFDRICDDLRIGVWDQEDHAAEVWKVSGRANGGEDVAMPESERAKIKPGDYAYFKNWDVTESAKKAGWQGENVISLGDGMYYGHPFGVVTGEKIVKYLNNNRHAGSTRSAEILDLTARVDPKVLEWDLTPNK